VCGRYSITVPTTQLAERFDAAPPSELPGPRYNAAPTQTLPVLLNTGERQIQLLRWGLIPRWAKDATTGYKMINARSESLTEKPAYRDSFKRRRCLVLADSFYEWQKTGDGKIPMRIMLKSGEPFAFAGLWETWKDPQDPEGELLRTFTIITGKPNDVVAPIHDRMPMILLPEDEKVWLDNEADTETWSKLLKPYPADLMRAYPISRRINATTNDDPSLIVPAA